MPPHNLSAAPSPPSSVRITLLQTDTVWHDATANQLKAARLMDAERDSQFYLLPEMWAVGFDTLPVNALADMSEQALEWMRHEAVGRRCAVAGTLPVRLRADGTAHAASVWRNRFFVALPDGRTVHYDKRNLFVPGGEQQAYTPGNGAVCFEMGGTRFMLQTCFDLRFPETARNWAAHPYDVLLYAANWPSARRTAWDALLPARAIENQCFCIGVNRTGSDPKCAYDGGSAAFDAYGRCLCRLDAREQAATVELDLEELRRFRKKFPVLR